MIGNDIVDLEEAKQKSNWQRPRFLEKLFTAQEQQLIRNSEHSFFMVWRLWSMKEAAYKLHTQIHPSRFYNPKGFECFVKNENENENGIVKFKDFECNVITQITSKYILSEARFLDFKMTSKVIELKTEIPINHSKIIKEALLNEISKLYQVLISDLKFTKSEFGIPYVLFDSEKIQVSLSHHGCFGGYAFF